MRKAIIVLASSVFLVAAIITTTACQSSAKKVENAQVNLSDAKGDVVLAKQELTLALQDSIQQFRIESERAINNNEKAIFELNAKMAEKKTAKNSDYQKRIAELEQRNSDLKKKLAEYKYTEPSNWESFKMEFNYDMNELGKALKDLTVKNTK